MDANTMFGVLLTAFLGIVVLCVKPLGSYIAAVMQLAGDRQATADKPGRSNIVLRAGARFEKLLYRLCGIDPGEEMPWARYAIALLLFNVLGAIVVYGLQRLQLFLPLNPQAFAAVSPESSFNTAVSFITNTNWQGYSGESTMGYLVQMAGLAVQNFLSAATGIAVAIALIRGFARHTVATIGNFWVDITRATLYVLLPLAAVLALILASQGVIQNFDGNKEATTVEKITYQNPKTDAAGAAIKDAAGNPVTEAAVTQTQTLPMGPVASQEAIKELGTNGGGFYNANSAHPYENPTALTNLLELLALFVIPFALTYTFGKMVGDTRQGWVILTAMLILWVPLVITAFHSEQLGNPLIAQQGIDQAREHPATRRQYGGQGSPLRHRRIRTVCGGHDRHIHRRGELESRFAHTAGRLRADVPHAARRGRPGRRGYGTVLHTDIRHPGRVHRRAHDWSDSRIPRKEDRGIRDEDGLGVHSDDAVCRSDWDGGSA